MKDKLDEEDAEAIQTGVGSCYRTLANAPNSSQKLIPIIQMSFTWPRVFTRTHTHARTRDARTNMRPAVKEALEWLDSNQDADKDTYDEKRKEVEDVAAPIMTKVNEAAGGGMGGDDADFDDAGAGEGPQVHEAD